MYKVTTYMDSALFGYAGKILRIDLTDGKSSTEDMDENDARMYLGGAGLSAKILYRELQKGADSLSPSNKLIFSTGPFAGSNAPGSGSVNVCFKSPLTNLFADSRAGSDFGPVLKKSGYDMLIIEGKANDPVYLVIDEDKIEIKDASRMLGMTTSEKTNFIKNVLGKDFEVACIGPAGENRVLFSVIMFGDGSRAAGRLGGGAVMGSKNLLAVALRGKKKVPIFNREEFFKISRDLSKKLLDNPGNQGLKTDGTTGDLGKCDDAGDWPTKNWHSNSWGKGQEIYSKFKKYNLIKPAPCYNGCILQCQRIVKSDSQKWKTPVHGGAEYESMSAFTAYIMNDDVDAAVHATYLCNEYGLDTISSGALISFAMEVFENKILGEKDFDGLDLTWGNVESAIKLLEKIAYRKGIGNILADGVVRASKIIGGGSEEFAVNVKGLEGPAHDPRSGKALAMTYGLSNVGMSHIHPIEGMAYDAYKADFGLIPYGLKDPFKVDRYDEEGKGSASKILHDYGTIPDIIGMCKFYIYAGLTPDDLAKELAALTGWNVDGRELLLIGERVYNLQRMFNVREGIRRKDDQIPERIKKVPEFGKYSTVQECVIHDYDSMLDEYYEARGWNREGIPTKNKLENLGLAWLNP
jgi:aldehyde:ferredoxin oxidoreductase